MGSEILKNNTDGRDTTTEWDMLRDYEARGDVDAQLQAKHEVDMKAWDKATDANLDRSSLTSNESLRDNAIERASEEMKQRQYEASGVERERYLEQLPNDVPGISYEEPGKFRMETTGTSDPEIAKTVTEASKFDYNPKGIDQVIDKIITDPSAVRKMLELRMQRTGDFMFGNGDYNKNTVNSDVNFLLNLMGKGFDFKDFRVDLNNDLGGKPDMVDFPGLVQRYTQGLEKLKGRGNNIMVEATPSSNIPPKEMSATEALQFMLEQFNKGNL